MIEDVFGVVVTTDEVTLPVPGCDGVICCSRWSNSLWDNFCGIGRQMLARMLWIEVQLPQQAARKKIEWNKHTDPTFQELKERLQQCGVPDDWCVEVLRGDDFLSPDVNSHITGPKITVRATPILGLHLTLSIASSASLLSCLLVLGILCGALFSSARGSLTAQFWEIISSPVSPAHSIFNLNLRWEDWRLKLCIHSHLVNLIGRIQKCLISE